MPTDIDNKVKAVLRELSKEKLRLMFLSGEKDNLAGFFHTLELYNSMPPPTQPAHFLQAICETCGINPNQTLPNDYTRAKERVQAYLPQYIERQKPLSRNYDLLNLKFKNLIRNKDFLKNAADIYDFTAEFTRFTVTVRTAQVVDPNNIELKKLKKECEKMMGEVEHAVKDIKKAQDKQIHAQRKIEAQSAPTENLPPASASKNLANAWLERGNQGVTPKRSSKL